MTTIPTTKSPEAPRLRPMLDAIRQTPDWREARRHADAVVDRIYQSRPTEKARRSAFVYVLMTLAGKPPSTGDDSD